MISEGYVRNGAKVYISSRDAKTCEATCKELNAIGPGSADYIAANFYEEKDVAKLAEEFAKREKSKFCIFASVHTRIYESSPWCPNDFANIQNYTY